MKSFLNPEGHQNRISGSKINGHFTEGVDLANWWSCVGKGLHLQSAQQACFNDKVTLAHTPIAFSLIYNFFFYISGIKS